MDYQNGRVDGYNRLSSFSYLLEEDGQVYRVNIIVAGRWLCDSKMKAIRKHSEVPVADWKIVCSNTLNK